MIIAWALLILAYCMKSTNRTKKKDHAKLVSEPFTACGVSHWSRNSAYKSEQTKTFFKKSYKLHYHCFNFGGSAEIKTNVNHN